MSETPKLPKAVERAERRLSIAWIVPVVVLVLVAWLGWRSWERRGVAITIRLGDGHGLVPGDAVMRKGIAIGEVSDVRLDDDGVVIEARLHPAAAPLARRGTLFWVVRPSVDLRGVSGIDTLTGSRYVGVRPGPIDAPPRRSFIGLDDSPAVEAIEPGDLELVLESPDRAGLSPGAQVLYRRMPVGTVLSMGLSSDGGSVEVRVLVQKAYTPLIRERTRFWAAGGADATLGIGGVELNVDSLETLLTGAVGFATPPPEDAGGAVRNGHRFRLAPEVDEDWLEWKPVVAIGSSLLPAGAALPDPLRAVLEWEQGRILSRDHSRTGWVIRVAEGIVGPANLLRVDEDANDEPTSLAVAGVAVAIPEEPIWSAGGIACIAADLDHGAWPARHIRRPTDVEDCVAIADRSSAPLPLAAARLDDRGNGRWRVDEAVPVSDHWHGAAVLARADGRLIGILLVDDEEGVVVLMPGEAEGEG